MTPKALRRVQDLRRELLHQRSDRNQEEVITQTVTIAGSLAREPGDRPSKPAASAAAASATSASAPGLGRAPRSRCAVGTHTANERGVAGAAANPALTILLHGS
jgi:hypothetical protein